MSKYSAALLHIAIVVLAALVTALDHGLTLAGVIQLAILALGSAAVYLVPLVNAKFAGWLKIGAASTVAVLAALVPFLTDGWSLSGVTTSEWITVILAGLGVLGSALGVSARLDSIPPIVTAVPAPSLNAHPVA